MPATITSSGTFTDLVGLGVIPAQGTSPDTTKAFPPGGSGRPPQGARGNEPDIQSYNLTALQTRDGVIYDELRQFIQLVQVAYSLTFWQAASLIHTLLKALLNSNRTEVTLGDAVSANRLFTP
jgi:hypothetical protein